MRRIKTKASSSLRGQGERPSRLHGSPERWGERRFSGVLLLLVSTAVLTATTHRLQGADWPQFRGPLANGLTTETSAPLRPEKPTWTADLPGRGISSPIIVGDRVFVTAASGARQNRLHVLCFDAQNGSLIWERRFWATGRTQCHPKTCVATPTPASDGLRLFVTFSSNDVIALDLSGNLIWLRGLTVDYPNASNSLGMASSLVIAGDTLVVMAENDSESFTLGLDLTYGLNRWKLQRPKMANWTSPVPLPSPDGASAVGLQSGEGFTAVDADTGGILWEYTDGAATIPSSVVFGQTVYLPSHGLTALKLRPSGEMPEQIWRSGQLRPDTASPIVFQAQVLVINAAGVLTSGSLQNGSRLWQLRLQGPFSASPIAGGSHLYCVNESGLIQIVDLQAEEGRVVGSLDLAETILSTPAIAQGALYVRSDRHLWKLK